MPIYEYSCKACSVKEEVLKSVKEVDDLEKCKKCGLDMKKNVSLTSFSLKGTGWYRDGYA